MLPEHGNTLVHLLLGNTIYMAQDDGTGILYLVIEEFAEILHIHLAFLRIYYCGKSIQLYVIVMKILYSKYNIT